MMTLTRSRSLTVLLALALVAAAGGGCTKAARTNRAIDRADRLFQAGEYGKAEVAYSNACRMASSAQSQSFAPTGLGLCQGRPLGGGVAVFAGSRQERNRTMPRSRLNWPASGRMAGRAVEAKEAAQRALKLQPGNEKALMALCDAIRGRRGCRANPPLYRATSEAGPGPRQLSFGFRPD